MLKQIGRFKTDSNGVIHLNNENDEKEFFNEINSISKKELKNLPIVEYDYEDKHNKQNTKYLVNRKMKGDD